MSIEPTSTESVVSLSVDRLILDTTNREWMKAKKTKGLRAKPVVGIFKDCTVLDKFLLNTLEGPGVVGLDNFVCIGETGDVWQQTEKALTKKYDVIGYDEEGWMVCIPKPENEVECFKVTSCSVPAYLQGTWGMIVDDHPNLQQVNIGDYVCRQPHDHTDQWVVRGKLFDATYTIIYTL